MTYVLRPHYLSPRTPETAAAATAPSDDLPRWNLADLYQGTDDPAIETDLAWAGDAAKAFSDAYKGRLADLSGDGLGKAVAEYEAIGERLGRIMSFAGLKFAENMEDGASARFQQSMQERCTDISSLTLFFTLELNRIDDARLDAQMAESTTLARYAPWLHDLRAFRPYQLSDELEQALHERHVTGAAAWNRLFEETLAGMRFPVDGEDLTLSGALNRLSEPDAAVRKSAAKAVGKGLGDNIKLFSLTYNTLVKDKAIDDKARGYARPVSYRNLANQVEDEVVDALTTAVRESFPKLSHRYYKLKAKWFGVDQMDYWDRNAPLPEAADRRYSWGEARDTVLGAYGAFNPDMADIAKQFFDKRWIDAPPTAGKDSGAFSHPTVPSAHPYILMNFHGRSRDVMTLAHELGHGVHQVLAAPQGNLLADTPLTLAETASVFGEMLTFRAMLDAETDPQRRRVLLAGKVEDMVNTVVRQVAFHMFETKVHDERAQGELSPERLGEIWMEVQTESLGSAFRYDDEYQHYWAYISHFIHVPFYVYAYAFGDCLVNSLYDVFQGGHPGFQAKYLDMLRAGGTLRHKELLAPFGLDASDPDFWHRGLSMLSGFVDELEQEL
ncbi:MAG: M3 family oligoendopeptidase [Rhodospirillales bacterium]